MYDLRFALEAKPNEPRGDLYFPTTASYLAFISPLRPSGYGRRESRGWRTSTLPASNFLHAVAQAIEAKKLFHIDLKTTRNSAASITDPAFGIGVLKAMFLRRENYSRNQATTARATSTRTPFDLEEQRRGVGISPVGLHCATSPILTDKARQFAADTEIQALLAESGADGHTTVPIEDAALLGPTTGAVARLRAANVRFAPQLASIAPCPTNASTSLVVDLLARR
jgi:xylose isomerase